MASLISPLDAIFLAVEKPDNPMHIGGLHLFTPAPGQDADDLRATFATGADVTIAEFFARRATRSWRSAGQWVWQPATPDLGYHVRAERLPAPGGFAELAGVCARLHAEPLDRSRPLWRAHLITGLADGRLAVYFKMHHALGDGQLTQRLLRSALSRDPSRRGAPAPWAARDPDGGAPRPAEPTRAGASLRSEASGLASTFGRSVGSGLRREAGSLSFSAPRSVLNPLEISGARRFAAGRWPTARIAAVRSAASTTSNDVVLAMCAGALRDYLTELGALPAAPLVAMVPVALRQTGVISAGGNSVGAVMSSLATDLLDPGERLATIHRWMVDGKAALGEMTSTQVLVMTALGMSPLLVQPLIGRVARPPFNLIISNVSGPRAPLYFNGARLDEIYPLSIPVDGQALNITCSSYGGNLSFGITGCATTLPRLARLVELLEDSLRALERSTGAR